MEELAKNSYFPYFVMSIIFLMVLFILFMIWRFRSDFELFIKDMLSDKTTISSKKFMTVFGSTCATITACGLVFYSAAKGVGLPGGSVELLTFMILFFVSGATAATAMGMKKQKEDKKDENKSA